MLVNVSWDLLCKGDAFQFDGQCLFLCLPFFGLLKHQQQLRNVHTLHLLRRHVLCGNTVHVKKQRKICPLIGRRQSVGKGSFYYLVTKYVVNYRATVQTSSGSLFEHKQAECCKITFGMMLFQFLYVLLLLLCT